MGAGPAGRPLPRPLRARRPGWRLHRASPARRPVRGSVEQLPHLAPAPGTASNPVELGVDVLAEERALDRGRLRARDDHGAHVRVGRGEGRLHAQQGVARRLRVGVIAPTGSQRNVQVCALAFGPAFTEMTRSTLALWAPLAAPPAGACTLPHAATTAAQEAASRMDRALTAIRSGFIFMPLGRTPAPAGSRPGRSCEAKFVSSPPRPAAGWPSGL